MDSNNSYRDDITGAQGVPNCRKGFIYLILIIIGLILLFLFGCSAPHMTIIVKDIDQIDTLEDGTLRITGPAVIKPQRK